MNFTVKLLMVLNWSIKYIYRVEKKKRIEMQHNLVKSTVKKRETLP